VTRNGSITGALHGAGAVNRPSRLNDSERPVQLCSTARAVNVAPFFADDGAVRVSLTTGAPHRVDPRGAAADADVPPHIPVASRQATPTMPMVTATVLTLQRVPD